MYLIPNIFFDFLICFISINTLFFSVAEFLFSLRFLLKKKHILGLKEDRGEGGGGEEPTG